MENRVGVALTLLQHFYRLGRGQHDQFNPAALRFASYVVHHRRGSRASTDHQATTVPRYVLFDGQRRVAPVAVPNHSAGSVFFERTTCDEASRVVQHLRALRDDDCARHQ